MSDVTAREAMSKAISYWEPRRLLFNAIQLIVVATIFVINLPGSLARLNVGLALFLFALAVLENVAYYSCHLVDVVAQLSAYRMTWLRYRWVLLLLEIAFAAALTCFLSTGILFAS
jgi:hypothetical protein